MSCRKFKYEVSKRMEIAGAHRLDLPYESKCENLHGHNWIVTVFVGSNDLDHGMVIDFTHIKRQIHDRLDHAFLNDLFVFNPSAENIAKWICDEVNKMREGAVCYRVTVQESEGNTATYNNI